MIKFVMCLHRHPDLTREQFQHHWRQNHGPLFMKFADAYRAKKYVQDHTIDTPLRFDQILIELAFCFSSYPKMPRPCLFTGRHLLAGHTPKDSHRLVGDRQRGPRKLGHAIRTGQPLGEPIEHETKSTAARRELIPARPALPSEWNHDETSLHPIV